MTPEQIKESRIQKGWSQQALADALGVSVRTVKHWEAGTRNMSRPVALLLMKSRIPNETFDRCSTDAMVWAQAFEEHKQRNNWTLDDIDEGLMVCWFANAMCAQMDADEKPSPLPQ